MKGTHGTCISRAEQIKQQGFVTSPHGRRGTGVYFWGYTHLSLEAYTTELAIAWWRYCKDKTKAYAKEADQGCCVIYASFNIANQDILDFENQQLRDKFFEFCDKVYPKIKGKDEEKISTLYDMFVSKVEKKRGKKYKMIHVKVQQPSKTRKVLPLDITGQPSCYLVKDLSCIYIDNFEEPANG